MRREAVITAFGVLGLVAALSPLPAAGAPGGKAAVAAVAPWRYSPNPVEINHGDTLTFVNLDSLSGEGHSLTHATKPGQELFKSPLIPQGTQATVMGAETLPAGEYNFTCRLHAFMSGKLVVK